MKKKGFLLATILTFVVAALMFSFGLSKFRSEPNDNWNNYTVLKNADGTVKGIGINDSTANTLTLNIPSSAPYLTADYVKNTLGDTETDFKPVWALVSFEFDQSFELSDYTYFLVQIDRRFSGNNTGPRLFLQASDGTIWGLNTGTARNDVFVKDDGSSTTWKNETAVRYTFQSNMNGTLNIPLSKVIKRVTGTLDSGSSTEIVRFIYGMDTSGSFKWYGDRPTGFGTMAVANTEFADDVQVKKLLSVQDLTYSTNAEDTTADVNLANMALGKKVHATHTITPQWALDPNPNYISVVNGLWQVQRGPFFVKVKSVATDGTQLKTQVVKSTYADGAYSYTITPSEIANYSYVSASGDLTGTLTAEKEIILTYKPANPAVTVKYVDGQGNTIKKATTVLTELNSETSKYAYTITPAAIDGYEYQSASMGLTGEITADTEITLTYGAKYQLIYQNGQFKGIYLTASTANTFAVSMPVKDNEHPFLTADTLNDANYKPQWAMITFKFDQTFSLNDFDTLLIQIDRSMNTNNTGPGLFLESTNGTIYSINTKSNHNDVFVKDNGALDSYNDATGGFRYTFKHSMAGTLNIPLSRIVKRIDGKLETGDATTICKLYYAMDTSGVYNWWGNRPTGFGTIAAASTNGDSVVVKELLEVQKCSMSTDATDTTSDINLANLKNGTKVFTEHTIYTNWVLDGSPDYIDLVNSQWVVSRVPDKVTVKCVDQSGKVVFIGYSNISGDAYTVTAPTISGYTYVSADKELTGSATEGFTITLTYSQNPTVFLSYVDENGNSIAGINNPSSIPATLDAETNKYLYTLTAPEFTGYYLFETVGELSAEITANATVEFKYHSLPTVLIRCLDEDGNRIAIVKQYAVKTESGIGYNVTTPKLDGRIFKSSNKELTGTYTEGLVIEITYSSKFVTVSFKDEAGATLHEDLVVFPTVNAEDSSKFDYNIEPVEVSGYHVYTSDKPLSGTISDSETIVVTYRKLPSIKVQFVDEEGNELRSESSMLTTYNSETTKYTYSVDTNLYSIFSYQFKESVGALNGEVEFGSETPTVVKLVYKTSDSLYSNFEVVTQLDDDDNPEFCGIWLKKSYAGGLNINVNNFDSTLGYGLTTVEFGRGISPEDSTGILIQIARTDDSVGGLQLRMYLEDTEGNLYRLFTQTNDRAGAINSTVLISSDGDYAEVTNEDVNWRHWVTAGQNGTMYIPWSVISNVYTNEAIPAGTIFTKLHFGRETRYNTTVNKPIALTTIAAVKVNNDLTAKVEIIRDLTTLNYSTDANDTTADVNLADMTKGNVVYMRRWLSGTHIEQKQDFDKVIALFEFSRVAPTITVKYVDENGISIRPAGVADAEYGVNGSTYEVQIPEIPGYEFVSASAELTGTVMFDTEIVLTLRLVTYTITVIYKDEAGNVIKEQSTVNGKFGEYVEIEVPTISGYTYKSSSSNVNFTITSDKELTLTYTDNSNPGNTTQAPTTQTPGKTTTATPDTPTEPSETGKKKGCKGEVVTSILGISLVLGSIVIVRRKRREE